jgi:hypothetical protein
MAHLDDDPSHSYLHNLVPLHPTLNQHLGGLKRNYGSPARKSVDCDYPQLEWSFLRNQALQHRRVWRLRHAYACARIGLYVYTKYFHAELELLYKILTECLYFARHIWNEEIIWALLDHDLKPLLRRNAAAVRRNVADDLVRQIAALWTEVRGATRAHALLQLTGTPRIYRIKAEGAQLTSILRRFAMDYAAIPTGRARHEAKKLAAESLSTCETLEAKINALEIGPWCAEANDDWAGARQILEGNLAPLVLPSVRTYVEDLRRRRNDGSIERAPLKIPTDLMPLNAAQVPIELAAAIVATMNNSKGELRAAQELVGLSLEIYEPMQTQPFMLTRDMARAYRNLASKIGEPRVAILSTGRSLSSKTLRQLKTVTSLVGDRLLEAKR